MGGKGTAAVLKTVVLALMLFGLQVLAACSRPAETERMVVRPESSVSAVDPRLVGAIDLGEVSGGQETDPLWTPEIGTAEFREALRQSLAAHGLLSDTPGTARYRLDARIVEASQPLLSFDTTVETEIQYTLTDSETRQQPFVETVSSSSTVPMADDLIGHERIKAANERAARASIRRFLQRLSSTPMP